MRPHGGIARWRRLAPIAITCLGAAIGLPRPRSLAGQAPSPGCDAQQLLARSDVRQGVAELYEQTRMDGREHVMLVFSDSVNVHPNALVGPSSIRFGVPPETIAIFHTHPAGTIETPSPHDVDALKHLQLGRPGVCSYVAGIDGLGLRMISEILPDGRTVLAKAG